MIKIEGVAMEEPDMFEPSGGCVDEAEKLAEASKIFAEKTGISLERAAAVIKEFAQALWDEAEKAFGCVGTLFGEIEEMAKMLEVEPRHQRRTQARVWAKDIEQRYRAEIRRVERERIYRRTYKPP